MKVPCLSGPVLVAAGMLLALAGCSKPTQPAAQQPPGQQAGGQNDSQAGAPAETGADSKGKTAEPVPPAPPRTFRLAAGSELAVQTTSTLSTKTNRTGETFVATLVKPMIMGDWVVAQKGATVEGVIVQADPGGRVKGVASMAIALRSIQLAD